MEQAQGQAAATVAALANKPKNGAIVETASSAAASRARAIVEARYVMAVQRPRSWDSVRLNLIAECKRPGFARAARYHKPVGQGVEGPSIRFAEAALRHMTNIGVDTSTLYDDEQKLILRVAVTDFESNVPYEQEVVVTKTVERRKLANNQVPLGTRSNSFGDTLYIVAATDDEILNKTNALVSKALRTLALRLLPGDILDECMELCVSVAQDEDAKDPTAARKALLSAFFSIGVNVGQIVEYLDHPIENINPAELTKLRAVYAAIRDSETSWKEVIEAERAKRAPAEEAAAKPSQAQQVIDKSKAKKAKAETKAPASETDQAPAETPATPANPEDDGR